MSMFVIATRNRHKTSEIHALLGPGHHFMSLTDFPSPPIVVEDAPTFEGNAAKKASVLAEWLLQQRPDSRVSPADTFVLADDSGLEVDALNGAPGVYSARFAALDSGNTGNSSDLDNNTKLLRLLANVPDTARTGRFRCVVALAPLAGGGLRLFSGACEGRIGFVAQGDQGFGYDPLFYPAGFDQSFAELGELVKNRISHRAQAVQKLAQALRA